MSSHFCWPGSSHSFSHLCRSCMVLQECWQPRKLLLLSTCSLFHWAAHAAGWSRLNSVDSLSQTHRLEAVWPAMESCDQPVGQPSSVPTSNPFMCTIHIPSSFCAQLSTIFVTLVRLRLCPPFLVLCRPVSCAFASTYSFLGSGNQKLHKVINLNLC